MVKYTKWHISYFDFEQEDKHEGCATKKSLQNCCFFSSKHCTMQQGLTFVEGGGASRTKRVSKFSFFINAMIFAFTTFVKNTPLYGKIASKV